MPPEALLKITTLGRSKPVGVLLLHGLFANSAFWLPYLRYFSHCRVTLVDIDYPALLAAPAPAPLAPLCQALDALAGAAPGHLVAHSFGCVVGAGLRSAFASRSFILPTFAAQAFDAARFAADLDGRGHGQGAAAPLFAAALRHKAALAARGSALYRPGDALYLARDDPYFSYGPPVAPAGHAGGAPFPALHDVTGGHFDITQAVRALAAARLGYTDQPG